MHPSPKVPLDCIIFILLLDFACGTGGFITSWLKELEPQIKSTDDREKFKRSVYGVEKKQFPYMLAITNLLLHEIDEPQIYHDNSLAHNVLNYTEKDSFDKILMNPPYGGTEGAGIKENFPDDLSGSETADLFMSVIMYRLKKNGRAAVVLPDGFLFGTDNTKTAIKKKLMGEFNLHTVIRLPGSVFAPYTSITTNLLFFDNTEPTKEVWFYRLDMPEGYKHFSKTKPMKLEHFQPVMDWWRNRVEIEEEGWPKAKKYTAEEIQEGGYNLDLCGIPHEEEEILDPMDLIKSYQEHTVDLTAKIQRTMAELTNRMESTEILPVTEYGVAAFSKMVDINKNFQSAMKKSLLQYAIQGKLVEQRAKEGTAQDLLKEIQAEKKRLIEEKKIKKTKPLPPITEDEIPFDIPEGWEWVRLGDLCSKIGSGNTPAGGRNSDVYKPEGIPLLREQNIYNNGLNYNGIVFISQELSDSRQGSKVYAKDLLLNITGGSIGRCAIVPDDFSIGDINQHILIIRLIESNLRKYVHSCICSTLGQNTINVKAVGARAGFSAEKCKNMLIPLPPLAEQHRIVAKLEELLPFCNRLSK